MKRYYELLNRSEAKNEKLKEEKDALKVEVKLSHEECADLKKACERKDALLKRVDEFLARFMQHQESQLRQEIKKELSEGEG